MNETPTQNTNSPIKLNSTISAITILVVIGLYCFLLEQFMNFDWGKGIHRAVLLFATVSIPLTLLVVPRKFTFTVPQRGFLAIVSIIGCLFAFGINVNHGIEGIQRTNRTNKITLDQGQNTYRAIKLLQSNQNPYTTTTMIDPMYYRSLLRQTAKKRHCLKSNFPANLKQHLDTFWQSVDIEQMKALIPQISDSADCADIKKGFASLGYKYGPSLLLSYYPFVSIFGKGGIFVTHLFLLFITVGILGFWLLKTFKGTITFACMPLLIFMVPSHLHHNIFDNSASDLAPTLLALIGFFCTQTGKPKIGVFALALSVTSKLLPGLLFVPLLLSIEKRYWAYHLFTICAIFNLGFRRICQQSVFVQSGPRH